MPSLLVCFISYAMAADPYLILNVKRGASDQEIRGAYLKAIRESPPEESNPEAFSAINEAYASIQTKTARFQHEIVGMDPGGDSPLDALLQHARYSGPREPMNFENLKQFLNLCSKT